jgi:hypothetical protein
MCQLEQGSAALLFASGMAAATAVFQALSPGDHVLAPKVMYWSLRNWLMNFATHWGLQVELIDMTDPAVVQAAIRSRADQAGVGGDAGQPAVDDHRHRRHRGHRACRGREAGGRFDRGTPVLTQPLALGADIVMHAATKYLGGHSDLIAGVLVARENDAYWQRIRMVRAQLGGTLGSFEAWLLLRGMRTLYLRVRHASASAQRIAEHFAQHRAGRGGAVPRPARRAGPRGGRAADEAAASAACCRSAPRAARPRRSPPQRTSAVEARHLAGRHREPDRTPRQRRRRGHAGAGRPAAPVGGHRGRAGRPDRRPGAGAGTGASPEGASRARRWLPRHWPAPGRPRPTMPLSTSTRPVPWPPPAPPMPRPRAPRARAVRRCWACPWSSRTTSTSPACRPLAARRR